MLLIIGAAVVEIAETGFWIWLSKRRKAAVGVATLVGRGATVTRDCRPRGWVKLDGELWEARCEAGADRGDGVRVVGVDGLVLDVERV